MKKKSLKLASSDTLIGIGECIEVFYCGSKKELLQVDDTTWKVVKVDGTVLSSVIVRLRAGRYVFEKLES